MRRRALLALLAGSISAGCGGRIGSSRESDDPRFDPARDGWTQFRGTPGRSARASAPSSVSTADGFEIVDTRLTSVVSPILAGDTVLTAGPETVAGYDTAERRLRFELPFDGPPAAPPARCGSVVAAATDDRVVGYDIDAEERVWTRDVRTGFAAGNAPAALRSHLVVRDDDRIRVIDVESGSDVNRIATDGVIRGFAVDADRVVVNERDTDGSRVTAFGLASGDRRWTVETERSDLHPVIGESGTVYVVSEFGRLVAIDDGAVVWRTETRLGDPAPPAFVDGVAVVLSQPMDRVVGVALDEPRVDWEVPIEFGASVVAAGSRVLVAESNEGVIVLDGSTGRRRTRVADARFPEELVPTADGVAFTRGTDGRTFLVTAE